MLSTLSKKEQALAIYAKVHGTNKDNRPEVIKTLINKVGLTEHGAQTYYSNMKNGVWPLVAAPTHAHPRQTRVSRLANKLASLFSSNKIGDMSITELNNMYNRLTGEAHTYQRRGVLLKRIQEALQERGALGQ